MNKSKNIALFAIIVLLFSGCKRCDDFENGEIIIEGDISFPVSLSNCYSMTDVQQADPGLYMPTKSMFDTYFPRRVIGCADTIDIDFSEYDLLSYFTEAKCNYRVTRNVVIDHENTSLVYRIRLEECDNCDVPRRDPNIIAIPALEETYNIQYEFELISQ